MTAGDTAAVTASARPRASVPSSARAVLTVDLAALRANWARLNQASGRAECAGVIKADAYGLGLAPIAKALTSEGCKTFFVASIGEGRTAREVGTSIERNPREITSRTSSSRISAEVPGSVPSPAARSSVRYSAMVIPDRVTP